MKSLESEEYSRLSSEIKSNGKLILNTALLAFSLYMTLLGYGISKLSGTIILCSLLPIILSLFVISSIFNTSNRIAGYLRIFYEKKDTNIFWETRLQLLRKDISYKSQQNFSLLLCFCTIIIITTVSSIVNFQYNENPKNILLDSIFYYSLLFMVFIGFVLSIRDFKFAIRKNDKMETFWKSLYKNEEL